MPIICTISLIPDFNDALSDAEAPGLRLCFPAQQHRLSLREHSQATRVRALDSLAADAGRTQLELPHHQGDSNFSRSCMCSRKTRRSRAGKAAAMEKFTRFFDLLDEINEQHQLARVLEDDEEQRALLEDDVVKLVVPSL
ncbi:hypothetical protein EDB89DRAFT_1094737 [Lactarius sanguifluus]|nr:hypothetical protein EDB89DRAFT_1094737 [Lactarius sanguifluus]